MTWTWWDSVQEKYDSRTASLPGTSERITIHGLEPYQDYVVTVSRVDTVRNVTFDVVRADGVSRTDPKPLPRPTHVTVQETETNSSVSQVVVKWNAPNGTFPVPIYGYLVVICPVKPEQETNASCKKLNTSSEDTFIVLEGLQRLADYVVEVRAFVEHAGRVLQGKPAKKAVATGPPFIPTVDHVDITTLNSTALSITWNRPAELDAFEVVYNVSVYFTASGDRVLQRDVNDTEIILTNLTPRTNYTSRVHVCLVRAERRYCGEHATAEFQTLPTGLFYLFCILFGHLPFIKKTCKHCLA